MRPKLWWIWLWKQDDNLSRTAHVAQIVLAGGTLFAVVLSTCTSLQTSRAIDHLGDLVKEQRRANALSVQSRFPADVELSLDYGDEPGVLRLTNSGDADAFRIVLTVELYGDLAINALTERAGLFGDLPGDSVLGELRRGHRKDFRLIMPGIEPWGDWNLLNVVWRDGARGGRHSYQIIRDDQTGHIRLWRQG